MHRAPLGEISHNARRETRGKAVKPARISNGRKTKDRDQRPRIEFQPMSLQLPYSDYELREQASMVPMGGYLPGYELGYDMSGQGFCSAYVQPCGQPAGYAQAPCYGSYADSGMVPMQMEVQPQWAWEPEVERSGPRNIPGDARRSQERERHVRRSEEREREREDAFVYPGHPAYAPIDVKVKNTFIDLPAPQTPPPAGRAEAVTPPIAATCPPKYAMGELARREWEEAREEAEEAAAVFAAGKDRGAKAPALDQTTSVGSLLHRAGLCKPCAWFHHAKGCQRGVRCEFCHCCPPGEIKKRKKEKTVLIRKRRSGPGDRPQYELPCW